MVGTTASASGRRVSMNSDWFRRERQREARGCVVHELVHVVQAYVCASRTNPTSFRTDSVSIRPIQCANFELYQDLCDATMITRERFGQITEHIGNLVVLLIVSPNRPDPSPGWCFCEHPVAAIASTMAGLDRH